MQGAVLSYGFFSTCHMSYELWGASWSYAFIEFPLSTRDTWGFTLKERQSCWIGRITLVVGDVLEGKHGVFFMGKTIIIHPSDHLL